MLQLYVSVAPTLCHDTSVIKDWLEIPCLGSGIDEILT